MVKKTAFSFIIISALYVFFFRSSYPQFEKLHSYEDLLAQSIECSETLVLFDIDDTLIWLPWPNFTWPLRLHVLWNFPDFIHADQWEHVYSKLWQQANFMLIEPVVVELINQLKSRGCTVLGLTSMESGAYGVISSMSEWRYQTLKHFGIEFTQKFGNHTLTSLPAYRDNYPMLYKGILCANQQPKGKVLEAFLKQLGLKPNKIISFDDEPGALQSIRDTCETLHIPVACYQYTGAERYERWSRNRMLYEIIKIEKRTLDANS